jgi:hypothetical protein
MKSVILFLFMTVIACGAKPHSQSQLQPPPASAPLTTTWAPPPAAAVVEAATQPPTLTRATAAESIAHSPLLEQPGRLRYPRRLLDITGISVRSNHDAQVEFTWRYFTRNDDADLPQHVATSIATMRLFDTGWRMESFSNADGQDDLTDKDRRLEIDATIRRISKLLDAEMGRGTPTNVAAPDVNDPRSADIDWVYIDRTSMTYFREDCTKPTNAVRVSQPIATHEGYRPSPSCYTTKGTSP